MGSPDFKEFAPPPGGTEWLPCLEAAASVTPGSDPCLSAIKAAEDFFNMFLLNSEMFEGLSHFADAGHTNEALKVEEVTFGDADLLAPGTTQYDSIKDPGLFLVSPDYFHSSMADGVNGLEADSGESLCIAPIELHAPATTMVPTFAANPDNAGDCEDIAETQFGIVFEGAEDEFVDIETVDNAESNASIEGSEKKIPAGIMLKLDPIQRIHFCIEETNRKLPQQKIDTDELSDSVAVSCLPPAQGPPPRSVSATPVPSLTPAPVLSPTTTIPHVILPVYQPYGGIYNGITTGIQAKKRRVADCDRELHNKMEKKRREELRVAQDSLKESIANVVGRSGSSLIDILRHAVNVLQDLRTKRQNLKEAYDTELAKKAANEKRLQALQAMLSSSGDQEVVAA